MLTACISEWQSAAFQVHDHTDPGKIVRWSQDGMVERNAMGLLSVLLVTIFEKLSQMEIRNLQSLHFT